MPVTLAIGLGFTLAACKTSEEKAEDYYQSGMEFLEKGDAERAIVQFRNVFELDGDHYDARKTLAEIYADQGKIGQSYSQYLRLAEQYPDDLDLRLTLARIAFTNRDFAEFRRHSEQAAKLNPDSPEVQALQLGLRYQAATTEDNVTTRKDVTTKAAELLKTQPNDPVLLEILLDEAARDKNNTRIGELIDKLIELQPNNPLRYKQRLAFLVETKQKDQIEQHLLTTIDQFPENDEAKADLIRFYLSSKNIDKAESFLRQRAEAAEDDNAKPQADLIHFLRAQRGKDVAEAELNKIIEAGGNPLVFQTMKAEFDFVDGHQDKAIASAKEILEGVTESNEDSRNLRIKLAHMLLQTGDKQGAQKQVKEVLSEDKSNVEALKLQAGWAIENDNADDAILSLRAALDHDPRDVMALGLMADAYARSGEANLSRDFLAQAARASDYAPVQSIRLAQLLLNEGRYRPAEDALIPALRKSPENVQLLGLLGQVYLAMPDLPRAGDVISRLRALSGETATDMADRLDLSRVAKQDGQDAALARLEELAKSDDAGVEEKLRLIQARLTIADFDGAKSLASDLVAENPDLPAAQLALAMATAAGGDMETAREIMRTLIASDPKQPAPYLALATLERTQDGNKPAIEVLEQGLKEIPNNADLLFTKANLIEREGDVDGAIAVYEQLYEQDTNQVVVANNLASLLGTWHGDDPAKLARASTISRRLKDSPVPAFMDTYGWIQHLNGDSQTALPYLEKAAEALKNDITVQIHLGLVQEALGQIKEATATLQQAVAMEAAPENSKVVSDAQAALTRMGKADADSVPDNQTENDSVTNN